MHTVYDFTRYDIKTHCGKCEGSTHYDIKTWFIVMALHVMILIKNSAHSVGLYRYDNNKNNLQSIWMALNVMMSI